MIELYENNNIHYYTKINELQIEKWSFIYLTEY